MGDRGWRMEAGVIVFIESVINKVNQVRASYIND